MNRLELNKLIKEELVKILNEDSREDLKKYGINELKNGLTIDILKKKYPWILKATIKDATLGEDENGLVWGVNGIWISGTWKDGTWKDGEWRNGTWEDGTWKNGSWKKGTFKGGVWEAGYWYDGTFDGGTWEVGTWKKGTFKSGEWEDKKNPKPTE